MIEFNNHPKIVYSKTLENKKWIEVFRKLKITGLQFHILILVVYLKHLQIFLEISRIFVTSSQYISDSLFYKE